MSARRLAAWHCAYLVATGVWPLVDRRSFEAVTGPKEDFWLARTVGGLAAVCGVALGVAVSEGRRTRPATALALGTAVVFTAADLRAARTESRAYLGDVLLQAMFARAWTTGWEDEGPA